MALPCDAPVAFTRITVLPGTGVAGWAVYAGHGGAGGVVVAAPLVESATCGGGAAAAGALVPAGSDLCCGCGGCAFAAGRGAARRSSSPSPEFAPFKREANRSP